MTAPPPPAPATVGRAHLHAIAARVKAYRQWATDQARLAREIQQLEAVAQMLADGKAGRPRAAEATRDLAASRRGQQDPTAVALLAQWPALLASHPDALPATADHGERLEWLALHHLPGHFPYTNGTLSARAGETPQRANTLAQAFDAVEAGLACGQAIDDVAPQVVLVMPTGTAAEQQAMAGIARRVWAIAMRDHYGAGTQAQQLVFDKALPATLHIDPRAADRIEAAVLAAFDATPS